MKEIALHILDIVHNSIRAKAGEIIISIIENQTADDFIVVITDNGKGIPPDVLPHVADPFTTSRKTRKVGMGLALLKQNAEQTGGSLKIVSEPGQGTTITCRFSHQHIDRPPIGDISGVILQLITAFPAIRFIYKHKTEKSDYLLDTIELKEALGDLPASAPEVRTYLKEMIDENLNEIEIER